MAGLVSGFVGDCQNAWAPVEEGMLFQGVSQKSGPAFPQLGGLALVLVLAGAALPGCSRQERAKSGGEGSDGGKPAESATLVAVRELTEGRAVKAVWLEETAAEGAPMARQIFAFDAAGKGSGMARLGGESGDLARPLVSADGEGVVVTRLGISKTESGFSYSPQVLWQPWDGGPAKPLGAGMAVDVWNNPADGAAYIYAVESLLPSTQGSRLTGETLVRFRVDKPEDREIVWTESALGAEEFQLSRDGRRAAGVFPFPKAAMANLDDRTLTPLASGAWTAMAADDSYAVAVLDGTRKRLKILAPNLNPGWELTFAGADGWPETGGAIHHPQWTNDARILVFTGPFENDTAGADVRLMRLRPDLRKVEKIARLTESRRALSPSVWVESGGAQPAELPQEPVIIPKKELKPWPSTEDGLVFAWESARREKPLPMAPASLKPHGFATVGRFFGMNLSGGWYQADAAAAEKIGQSCAASNAWSMELILTERTTLTPVSVRLAALILNDGREAFALYRVDRKLVLRVLLGGTPDRPAVVYPVVLTNLAIESDRPVQVLMSLRNNRLSCWVDGQMMKDFSLESSGLAAWGAGKLSFGDAQPYGTPWTGWMERVAVFSRALSYEECRESAETAAQWLEGRTRPTRSKVQAKLLALPAAPANAHSAGGTENGDRLALSAWEVEQVFMGQVEEKRIAVADWDQLSGAMVPPRLPEVGKSMELWLETWEDHPELENIPERAAALAGGMPRYFLARPLQPPPVNPAPR